MKFTETLTYEHPAAAVFGALTDFATLQAMYEASGQSDVQLERRDEGDDGSVAMVTRRVVPLELPGFAKKVLSPKQKVTQTEEWSAPDSEGGRTGSFTVESKGTPVQLHGTHRLAPTGPEACTRSVTVDVECRLPLIGGKIADLVAKETRRNLDHEQAWMTEHLASP